MRDIMRAAAALSDTPIEKIRFTQRTGNLVDIRTAISIVARRRRCSFLEIGRAIHRDHTTVISGIASKRASKPEVLDLVAKIDSVIGEPEKLEAVVFSARARRQPKPVVVILPPVAALPEEAIKLLMRGCTRRKLADLYPDVKNLL